MADPTKAYHGDNVRTLFLVGAFIMTAMLPIFATRIDGSIGYSVIGIIILCVAAGLTSPHHKLPSAANVLIALCSVVIFESYAVALYTQEARIDFFFAVNQILALIFVAALYFSIKTIRRMIDPKQD